MQNTIDTIYGGYGVTCAYVFAKEPLIIGHLCICVSSLVYMCGVCGVYGVNKLYGVNCYTAVTPHIYTKYDTHMHEPCGAWRSLYVCWVRRRAWCSVCCSVCCRSCCSVAEGVAHVTTHEQKSHATHTHQTCHTCARVTPRTHTNAPWQRHRHACSSWARVSQCVARLHCVALCCIVLQGGAGCCRVLRGGAGWCRVVHCVAGCCRVLQWWHLPRQDMLQRCRVRCTCDNTLRVLKKRKKMSCAWRSCSSCCLIATRHPGCRCM